MPQLQCEAQYCRSTVSLRHQWCETCRRDAAGHAPPGNDGYLRQGRAQSPAGPLRNPAQALPARLGSEIIFDGEVVRIRGRHAALLAPAAGKKVGTARVPTSVMGWGG